MIFHLDVDNRLSAWVKFRKSLENHTSPFEAVTDFWRDAPFIPYNNKIDPFNKRSWPSPWEIIVDNKYDDFTKAVMMAYTIKLTKRYKNTNINIKTVVDKQRSVNYNLVCVDDEWVLNYHEHGPLAAIIVPDYFFIENMVEF